MNSMVGELTATHRLGRSGSVAWAVLFGWAMCDTLVLYLARPWFFFPLNTLIPFLVVLVVLLVERGKFVIPGSSILWMFFIGAGYGIAVGIGVESFDLFAKDTVKMFCMFVIGFCAIVRQRDHRMMTNVLFGVGMLYTAVCVMALFNVSSTYLPVGHLEGYINGVLVRRAEITTDQNFQIFYLFPAVLGLALFKEKWKISLSLIGALGIVYVMVQLGTRSGTILLAAAFGGSIGIPWWYKLRGGRQRIIIMTVVGLLAFVYLWPVMVEVSQGFVLRWSASKMNTLQGRIFANLYLIQNILNPAWWWPKGMAEFVKNYGNVPHSAPTSIYLQAGIFGIIGWVMLIAKPLISGMFRIAKKQGNPFLAMIILGGFVSFVGSLTLSASFYEQMWLWAGATAGAASLLSNNNRCAILKRTDSVRVSGW